MQRFNLRQLFVNLHKSLKAKASDLFSMYPRAWRGKWTFWFISLNISVVKNGENMFGFSHGLCCQVSLNTSWNLSQSENHLCPLEQPIRRFYTKVGQNQSFMAVSVDLWWFKNFFVGVVVWLSFLLNLSQI